MATGQWIGVNSVARKIKSDDLGVASVAREVKSGYIGVSGVARQFYSSLDTTLTILGANQAGYWTKAATFGHWNYDEDAEEDGGDNYYCQFVNLMTSNMSAYGNSYVGDGGSYGGMDNHFLAYNTYRRTMNYLPSKFAFAFFCPTKNHADALAQCITNRYTKIQSGMEYWGTDKNTLGSVQRTVNITSVTSLGLCSEIGYKMYYKSGTNGYYDFTNDSTCSSLYVVEVVTDNCLYYSETRTRKKSFYVKFA